MTAELGKAGRRGVGIDVDALIAGRLLLTAMSGAGKSWALRRILEQTHGQVQQLVLDPEGEFYTLRERFGYLLGSAGEGGDPVSRQDLTDLTGYKRTTRNEYIRRLVARELVEISGDQVALADVLRS